jgi:hypothetical protein
VGEDVIVGAADMLAKLGAPVAAGMQSDPPQESPMGQHAVTPLKTQVGWAPLPSQVTEQRPTPSEEKHAAPEGQQPEPSGQTVSVCAAQVNWFCRPYKALGGRTARAVTTDR